MTQADKTKFQSKFKRGVSLIHSFDKSLYYSVQCDCGDQECGSIVEIMVDDEFKLIEMHFYKDVHFDFWRYPDDNDLWLKEGFINFIKDLYCNKLINGTKRFLYRWKKALILGFTGEIKLHGDFVLLDLDHIDNFIEALKEGRDYCVEVKKEKEPSIVDDRKIWGNPGLSGITGVEFDKQNPRIINSGTVTYTAQDLEELGKKLENNTNKETISKTIEFLQKCKPLLDDKLIEEYYIIMDKLTLLLAKLVK